MELYTTQGPLERTDLGLVLPTEHVFVDLGPMEEANWRDADPADVVDVMAPEIERARAAGVTRTHRSNARGVGRRVDIDLAVSAATGFPSSSRQASTRSRRSRSGPARGERRRTRCVDGRRTDRGRRRHRRPGRLDQGKGTDDDDPTGLSDDEAKILRAAARGRGQNRRRHRQSHAPR